MSNILIIKHGSLGDIAQASGAIQDIFENHPNDKIYLLTTKPYFELFKKNPNIHEVILDKRLSRREYIVDEYSIADISIWPWTARFERHQINLNEYPNVLRWYLEISNRTAVIKGYNVVGDYYEIPTV